MRSGLRSAIVLCLCAIPAFAETIELVTYYPPSTPGDGDGHFAGLTVGTGYQTATPEEGTALIGDRLGIGTTAPVGSLEVVGPPEQNGNVLLRPGAGGTMRLTFGNGGVGGPSPEGTFSDGDKLFLRGDTRSGRGHKMAIGIGAGQELWFQSSGDSATPAIRFYTSNNDNLPVEVMRIEPTGRVGIGTVSPAATALLEMTSTTQGFLPPRMTTAQRAAIGSPAAGLMVFDTTLESIMLFSGTDWVNLTPAPDPPIGTIEAWHKSAAGTPALPAGWVECNGQTLSDPDSPYNGRVIPNLNYIPGRNLYDIRHDRIGLIGRFLRGGAASGTMQAATVHFQFSDIWDWRRALCPLIPSPGVPWYDTSWNATHYDRDFGATEPARLFTNYGNWLAGSNADDSYASRPVSMTVVWILRVK